MLGAIAGDIIGSAHEAAGTKTTAFRLFDEYARFTDDSVLTVAALAKRDEVKRTGISCLVGPDPDAPGRERVFVGEGDSVWTRLVIHDKNASKDFWNRVVFVISKDQNLT